MGNGTLHVGSCRQLYTILDNKLEKWCSFHEAETFYTDGVRYGADEYKYRCANLCQKIKQVRDTTMHEGCIQLCNNVCTDVPMTDDAIKKCIKNFRLGKMKSSDVAIVPVNAYIGPVFIDKVSWFRQCGIHTVTKSGLLTLKWKLIYDTKANLFNLQNHDMAGAWYHIVFKLNADCNVSIATVDITTIARFDGAAAISGTKHYEAQRYTQKYLPVCQSLIDRMQMNNTLSKLMQG